MPDANFDEILEESGEKTSGATARPVIEPVFQDEKNGQYKVISFYAKKARGLMAAWILRKGIDTPAGLKKFREAGYRYDKEASTDSRPVFRRGEQ